MGTLHKKTGRRVDSISMLFMPLSMNSILD